MMQEFKNWRSNLDRSDLKLAFGFDVKKVTNVKPEYRNHTAGLKNKAKEKRRSYKYDEFLQLWF